MEQQEPPQVSVPPQSQILPEPNNDTSQRTADSVEPSPSENTCPICLQKLAPPMVILLCIHKYHPDCIADWLLECSDQAKEAICTIDHVLIGEEIILDGATVTVKELMQKRTKEKDRMKLKKVPSGDRHSDLPAQPVRRGTGRPRGRPRGSRGRGRPPVERDRSRSRNGRRNTETSSRRELAHSARIKKTCVLCLRNDPGLSLIEKPCPGRVCRSMVPQHIECLEALGNRNGSTDCYECDKRRHPTEYQGQRSRGEPEAPMQGMSDSELQGSSFHPDSESPSESISPSPQESSEAHK